MTEKRNVRADETRNSMRDEQARPDTAWKPPSLLDAPEPRPGYTQRWIATSIQGRDTPDNVFKRMREGWNPRKADSVKDKLFPTINHGQWSGSIGIEGMLLCEMPTEKQGNLMRWEEKQDNLFIKLGNPLRAVAEIFLLWMIKNFTLKRSENG